MSVLDLCFQIPLPSRYLHGPTLNCFPFCFLFLFWQINMVLFSGGACRAAAQTLVPAAGSSRGRAGRRQKQEGLPLFITSAGWRCTWNFSFKPITPQLFTCGNRVNNLRLLSCPVACYYLCCVTAERWLLLKPLCISIITAAAVAKPSTPNCILHCEPWSPLIA